jgi:hypothetical protein
MAIPLRKKSGQLPSGVPKMWGRFGGLGLEKSPKWPGKK